MKKLLLLMMAIIATFCCTETVSAQQRTKVADGVYIALYGNVAVVENDNTQQTVKIRVIKSDSLYDIMCGDTVVRQVTQEGIKEGINKAFEYIGLDGWVSRTVVSHYVNKYYQNVCDFIGR